MSVAAKNVIKERFGGGAFASQAAHNDRAKSFINDCKQHGIRSFDQLTKENLEAYGERLSIAVQNNEISINTAQNRLSTANIILEKTNSNNVRISPSEAVGERTTARIEPPTGLDKRDVAQAVQSMRNAGFNRAASVTELCREFGVREREASCADLNRWLKEAQEKSAVNIVDACKGGRNAPRWIQVTSSAMSALNRAIQARPNNSKNLINNNERYHDFRQKELNPARKSLKQMGIKGYHDLRSAWACDRYKNLTGNYPPCITGINEDRAADKKARQQIGKELGHNRIDVCAAYLGARGR